MDGDVAGGRVAVHRAVAVDGAVLANRDDHVLRLRDVDDRSVVEPGVREPQRVVFEVAHEVAGEVPHSHRVAFEGEETVVLVQKDEGDGLAELLVGQLDHRAVEQIDDAHGRLLLLEDELFVELLDDVDPFVFLNLLSHLTQHLTRLNASHLQRQQALLIRAHDHHDARRDLDLFDVGVGQVVEHFGGVLHAPHLVHAVRRGEGEDDPVHIIELDEARPAQRLRLEEAHSRGDVPRAQRLERRGAAAQRGVQVVRLYGDGDERAVALVVEERAHHLRRVFVENARPPAREALERAADAVLRQPKHHIPRGADLLHAVAALHHRLEPRERGGARVDVERQAQLQVGEALARGAAREGTGDFLVDLPLRQPLVQSGGGGLPHPSALARRRPVPARLPPPPFSFTRRASPSHPEASLTSAAAHLEPSYHLTDSNVGRTGGVEEGEEVRGGGEEGK
mmetsp:Transcript_2657/g.5569  ORF Transcript_2657/g.5569 Transcript_2657/m.5569 type:complete len:452 (+) Transcript_2657:524-1879(+)